MSAADCGVYKVVVNPKKPKPLLLSLLLHSRSLGLLHKLFSVLLILPLPTVMHLGMIFSVGICFNNRHSMQESFPQELVEFPATPP